MRRLRHALAAGLLWTAMAGHAAAGDALVVGTYAYPGRDRAAAVAAVDLERGGLAGDDTVDVQAALRELVVDQADDADLLGGLFHDDEADHIVALEADAFFLELRKDRAAVDLAGDAARGGVRQHVGGVEAPAQADFNYTGIGFDMGEGQEHGGGGHFEEAGAEILALVQHFGQEIREERGLAYSVFSSVAAYSDAGSVVAYAGTSPERVDEVRKLLDAKTRG